MVNFRLLTLLTFLLLVFVLIPSPTKNLSEEVDACLKFCSNRTQEMQELASLSFSTANKTGIPTKLLLSILITESYNRPIFIRTIEKGILKLFVKAQKIGNFHLPDLSIGLPQLKLTTALWIDSGFKNAIPLSNQPINQIKYIVNKLENLETSIEFTGLYLKRLLEIEQQLIDDSQINYDLSKTDPSITAKVASRYQGGVPTYATKITQYGKFVSLIAESNTVSALL